MRFDDPQRRNRGDPLAPVRGVLDEVNSQLAINYVPGCFMTVDEQLIEFHGRVKFKQYIPSKPGKFGIKVFWIVDAENTFPLKSLVYIGKDTLSEEERMEASTLGEAVVMNLAEPFIGCGWNITADNWFTDLTLAQKLLQRRTTFVGTVRNNRRFIPPAAKKT